MQKCYGTYGKAMATLETEYINAMGLTVRQWRHWRQCSNAMGIMVRQWRHWRQCSSAMAGRKTE